MEPTIEELSSKISKMQKTMEFQEKRIEHLEGVVKILQYQMTNKRISIPPKVDWLNFILFFPSLPQWETEE